MWHSLSHTLSMDVFRVNSFSARIITIAYAFLVLIITHTYTANLAAFLTVQQLDTSIDSVSDLKGRAVATLPPYVDRLEKIYHVQATAQDGVLPRQHCWAITLMCKSICQLSGHVFGEGAWHTQRPADRNGSWHG